MTTLQKGLLLLVILTLAGMPGCKNSGSVYSSEEEWRLAWRVWESENLDENFSLGAKQFDSLLSITADIQQEIFESGIHCFAATNQYTKIYTLLKSRSDFAELNLCRRPWFRPPNTEEWGDMCDQMAGQENPEMPEIKKELLILFINDQLARGQKIQSLIRGTGYEIKEDEIYVTDMESTDAINRKKLQLIIETVGFPTKKMVGEDGMKSMYSVISHANRDVEFQKSQLENVKKAAERGDLTWENYAFLYDQIEVIESREQTYGTHYMEVNSQTRQAVLFPVQDEENLNKRRMKLGLMPIETATKVMYDNLKEGKI